MTALGLPPKKIKRLNYSTGPKISFSGLRDKRQKINRLLLQPGSKPQSKVSRKISMRWLDGVSSFLGIDGLLHRYYEEQQRLCAPLEALARREQERLAAKRREEEERLRQEQALLAAKRREEQALLAAKRREEEERLRQEQALLAAKRREGYELRQQSKLRKEAARAKIEAAGGTWMSSKAYAAFRAKKKQERAERKSRKQSSAPSSSPVSKHVVLATAPKVYTSSRSYNNYSSALSLWPLWLSQFLYFSFILSHSFIGFFWIQLYLLSTYKWGFDPFSIFLSKDAYPLFQRVVFFNSRISPRSLYFIAISYSSRYLVNSSRSYYDMDRKALPKRRLWFLGRRPWRRFSPHRFMNYKRFASVSFFKKRVYLLSDYSHASPMRRPKALFFSSLRAVRISR